MIDNLDICGLIRELTACQISSEGRLVHQTMLQYPSGSLVRIFVHRQSGHWIVSDHAGAFNEVSSAGIDQPTQIAAVRKLLRRRGLTLNEGAIEAAVTEEALQAAFVSVANASRDVADLVISAGQGRKADSIEARTRSTLINSFKSLVSKEPIVVRGKSEKPYRFDTALRLPDNRIVLVDAVKHHPISINATVVNNLDIQRMEDDRFIQRIVFDPADEWKTEEISLLRQAAIPVAISHLQQSIGKVLKSSMRLH